MDVTSYERTVVHSDTKLDGAQHSDDGRTGF